VLDFSMTKESNSGFIGVSPEFSLGKVKRIVESNYRVAFLGKSLKISLDI